MSKRKGKGTKHNGRRNENPPRRRVLPISFPSESYQAIRERSKETGETISGWIRRQTIRALKQPDQEEGAAA